MIATKAETTITCDRCGKTIAQGERWFQVQHSVASGVFAGTASDLTPVVAVALQLCEPDYDASQSALAEMAPIVATPASLPAA